MIALTHSNLLFKWDKAKISQFTQLLQAAVLGYHVWLKKTDSNFRRKRCCLEFKLFILKLSLSLFNLLLFFFLLNTYFVCLKGSDMHLYASYQRNSVSIELGLTMWIDTSSTQLSSITAIPRKKAKRGLAPLSSVTSSFMPVRDL